MSVITEEETEVFRRSLNGDLIIVDSHEEGLETTWNSLLKGRDPYVSAAIPAYIVECSSAADASRAVQFGRDHSLKVYARGSGHHYSGIFLPPAGILVNLSRLKEVLVDAEARTATVQAGVTAYELYRETAQHGLHFPGPNVSTVGLSGFILGGGQGTGCPAFGAGCDNVLSMEVIDGLAKADEAPRTVDATSEPDLFFGLLGAGANLAIVTSFRLRLHPVSARLPTSLLVYPVGRSKEIYHWWRRWREGCPREVQTAMVFGAAHEGKEAVVMVSSRGFPDSDEVFDALWLETENAPPGALLVDQNLPAYLESMTELDAAWTSPGTALFSAGGFADEVSDEVLDKMVAKLEATTSPRSCLVIDFTAGTPEIPNAFGFRNKLYVNAYAIWTRTEGGAEADDDERHTGWARSVEEAVRPALVGKYSNEMMYQADDDPSLCFEPETWERLLVLKEKYDPACLFRPLEWVFSEDD